MIPLRPFTKMNKTEQAYANHLELLRRGGEVVDYAFERCNLRLADNTYYRPDFLVVYEDRFEFHEVKGFWRDDARVKIKVAAEQNPWFRFVVVKKTKGSWEFERICRECKEKADS